MVEGYGVDIYEEPASLKMGGRVVTFAAALYDDKMNRVAEFYTKEHAEAFMRYATVLYDIRQQDDFEAFLYEHGITKDSVDASISSFEEHRKQAIENFKNTLEEDDLK